MGRCFFIIPCLLSFASHCSTSVAVAPSTESPSAPPIQDSPVTLAPTDPGYCGTCSLDSTGSQLLSSVSCTGFYQCINGQAAAYTPCEPGLLFSAELMACDWESEVACECGGVSGPTLGASSNSSSAPPTQDSLGSHPSAVPTSFEASFQPSIITATTTSSTFEIISPSTTSSTRMLRRKRARKEVLGKRLDLLKTLLKGHLSLSCHESASASADISVESSDRCKYAKQKSLISCKFHLKVKYTPTEDWCGGKKWCRGVPVGDIVTKEINSCVKKKLRSFKFKQEIAAIIDVCQIWVNDERGKRIGKPMKRCGFFKR